VIISLAFAMGSDYVIGKDGRLPWTPDEVPGEQALFKKTTRGKPVIMGRKTWESLPAGMRPLPARTNLVLTRNPNWSLSGEMHAEPFDDMPGLRSEPVGMAKVVTAYRMPLAAVCEWLAAQGHAEAVVIGGADLFAQVYERAERAYVTLVDGRHDGDTFFPRSILSDPRWTWQPDPIKGRGWTRYLLNRQPGSQTS
jgi:dihydrofolate reductase